MSKAKKAVLSVTDSIKEKYEEKIFFPESRKRLTNDNFSIISPNCYAGLMYHRLGKQFLSPTINLHFPIRKKYLKFCQNLEHYLSVPLTFIDDKTYGNHPVGMLEDVMLVFNHYKSAQEAEEAWYKRRTRVNYDNLFMIFDDIKDAEYEDLLEFNKIPCKGKVIFTAKQYDDLPNAVQVTKYRKKGTLGMYLTEKNVFTGKNPADKVFDFVEWLNGNPNYKK